MFAIYTLGERFSANKIIGLILGVSGAIVLVLLGGRKRKPTNAFLAIFFVFVN